MLWIKSWIENPSKSKVIGHCGGEKKTNYHAERQKWKAKKNKNLFQLF